MGAKNNSLEIIPSPSHKIEIENRLNTFIVKEICSDWLIINEFSLRRKDLMSNNNSSR